MTSEICEDCGKTKEKHCEQWFENGAWHSCKKFKAQNHSPQDTNQSSTPDEVVSKIKTEDTEPEEASPRKASGSGSLSDENVKEKVKEMFFPEESLSDKRMPQLYMKNIDGVYIEVNWGLLKVTPNYKIEEAVKKLKGWIKIRMKEREKEGLYIGLRFYEEINEKIDKLAGKI